MREGQNDTILSNIDNAMKKIDNRIATQNEAVKSHLEKISDTQSTNANINIHTSASNWPSPPASRPSPAPPQPTPTRQPKPNIIQDKTTNHLESSTDSHSGKKKKKRQIGFFITDSNGSKILPHRHKPGTHFRRKMRFTVKDAADPKKTAIVSDSDEVVDIMYQVGFNDKRKHHASTDEIQKNYFQMILELIFTYQEDISHDICIPP